MTRQRTLAWLALGCVALAALGYAATFFARSSAHGPAPRHQVRSGGLSVPSLSLGRGSSGVGRLYMSIGRSPTSREVGVAATHYDVVVLNAWDERAALEMKRIRPAVLTLVYKDLASTRSYAVHHGRDDRWLPTGVGYQEAHPSWFAQDSGGRRIEWDNYPGHWMMAVWEQAYRARWVSNVKAQLTRSVWDGVFADNDMYSLRPYSKAVLKGSPSRERSDLIVRRGLGHLVVDAGRALRAAGKLLLPNVGDARLDLPRWRGATAGNGGMDEQFAHFGTDASAGYVTDWGHSGWTDQTSELASPLTLLVTRAAPGDDQALRFGLGSALVRSRGPVVWTGATTEDYSAVEWFTWQGVDLGRPLSPGQRRGNGVWWRQFAHGLVLVNPTEEVRTSTVPTSLCTLDGRPSPSPVRLAGHDALLLLTAAGGVRCQPVTPGTTATARRQTVVPVSFPIRFPALLGQVDEVVAGPNHASSCEVTR